MESKAFSLLQSLQTPFCFIYFFFTISFSLFSLSLFLLRQNFWCNCTICRSYLTSNWTTKFHNLCDWYTHLLTNSPTQTIHIHVLGNTITANPENVEHILKTKFHNYPKGKPFSMILGDLLGKGIFNVDGDLWLFQRKMASLELGSISIRSYAFEIVTAEIKYRLLPLLSSVVAGKEIGKLDLQEVFRRFSFDNICKFSFGLDPGCLETSLPVSLFADLFDLATKLSAERATAASPIIWKIKRLLKMGNEKKLEEAIKMVKLLANEVIMQKKKLGFSTHQDLLSRFMVSINDDAYLRDIVISFILAGRDTMSSALTSFFYLLATHPQVVSKIRNELGLVLMMPPPPSQELFVSFEQIREMQYLHAAVYESLRLYPPVQFDSKFASEDDILPDGTFVMKGTRVTYHSYAMGRMETSWGPDCLEFKPERWLKNGSFSPESPYKYPVFQAGIRVCLGKEMAIVEMKTVAVYVLHRFDIEVVTPNIVAPPRPPPPLFDPGLTATMRGGLRVVVRERKNNINAVS